MLEGLVVFFNDYGMVLGMGFMVEGKYYMLFFGFLKEFYLMYELYG